MPESHQNYPLAWPIAWERTEPFKRRESRFGRSSYQKPSLATAADLVELELERLRARDVVISTNVPPTLSGRPRSGVGEPADPGVAVYFTLRRQPRVLAADRFARVACNLYAIGKHVEAIRGMERWGVGTVDQAFTAYAALGDGRAVTWRAVLGISDVGPVDVGGVIARHRALALAAHPDRGGSDARMAELNVARDAALAELARSSPSD